MLLLSKVAVFLANDTVSICFGNHASSVPVARHVKAI